MTGRAKWDAWSSAGRTFVQREDAERRYLEIARNLGWAEDIVVQEPKDQVTLLDTWEEDDGLKSSSNPGAGSRGMGGAVSAMLPPVQEADESIHGFAISNDASALSTLLETNPATNVNELDEFVSSVLFCIFLLTIPQGYTPLHLACDRGNFAAVQMLLSKGADPAIKVGSYLVKLYGIGYQLLQILRILTASLRVN
jgi:Ankyrin repeat